MLLLALPQDIQEKREGEEGPQDSEEEGEGEKVARGDHQHQQRGLQHAGRDREKQYI